MSTPEPTPPPEVQKSEVQAQVSRLDSYLHAIIVLVVLASATALRVLHELDVATLSTVYGAALGFATGLSVRRRNGV